MEWRFSDPPNAAVFTTWRVVERQAPVVRLIWDDDGDWQALDAFPRGEEDAALLALASLLELHPDLVDGVELLEERGWGSQAVRESNGRWTILPFSLNASTED